MSKRGHFLTAAALAYCLYERSGNPALAVTTLLASSFPDIAEGVTFRGRWRTSLIPHRTITHWAPLYLVLLCALPFLALNVWLVDLCRGLCYGSLLHIFMDFFSPCGVPMINPFGSRRSFGFHRGSKPCLYRTGTVEEVPIIALTVGVLIGLAPYPALFAWQQFGNQAFVKFAIGEKMIVSSVFQLIHHQ